MGSTTNFPIEEDLQHQQSKLSMDKKILKNSKKIHKKGSKKKNAYSSNKDDNKKAEEISKKSAASLRQSGNTKKTHKKTSKKKNDYSSGKGKKAKEISKKSAGLKQSGNGCLVNNCLDLAVSYINLLRTKVANYQKQVARLGKLTAATLGKFAKQNSFVRTVDHLVAAGGGDLRNLSCGSSTNNTGTYVLSTKNKFKYMSIFGGSYGFVGVTSHWKCIIIFKMVSYSLCYSVKSQPSSQIHSHKWGIKSTLA
jgi:hypothetical protein